MTDCHIHGDTWEDVLRTTFPRHQPWLQTNSVWSLYKNRGLLLLWNGAFKAVTCLKQSGMADAGMLSGNLNRCPGPTSLGWLKTGCRGKKSETRRQQYGRRAVPSLSSTRSLTSLPLLSSAQFPILWLVYYTHTHSASIEDVSGRDCHGLLTVPAGKETLDR